MKPSTAPQHLSIQSILQQQTSGLPEIKREIARKNEKLLSLLKDVHVDSKGPLSFQMVKDAETHQEPTEFRLPKGHHFAMDIKNVPKGKISIVQTMTLLHNHTRYPDTWTAEKIAQECHLKLEDVNSLLLTFQSKSFLLKRRKQ